MCLNVRLAFLFFNGIQLVVKLSIVKIIYLTLI
jgi:hypothetical protein